MKSLRADFTRRAHCIMGLPFDALTLEQATQQIRQAAFERKPCFVSTPNLNFLIASQRNKHFRESVLRSDLSLPDGMPIVWMSKLLSIPITERVAGADVFDALRKSTGRKLKVYFFGGQPGVAERAMSVLNAEDGGVECVGCECPGFGSVTDMSSPQSLEKINASRAEFLVVSLGAVKGQAWIEHNLDALRVPVVCHLGAVVNFVAGNVRRAPRWMQVTGTEWIWRIAEEPMLLPRYGSDARALLQFGLGLVHSKFLACLRLGRSKIAQVPLVVQHSCSQQQLNIHVAGTSTSGYLQPLANLLAKFADQNLDIVLNLDQMTSSDSAFWGLVALVSGQQLNKGRSFKVEGQRPGGYSFDVASL